MTKFRYEELNPWNWRNDESATRKKREDVGYYDIEVHLSKDDNDVVGIGMPADIIEEERRAIYNDRALMEELADLPEERREKLLDFLVETFCYYRIEGELISMMKVHAMFSEPLERLAEYGSDDNRVSPLEGFQDYQDEHGSKEDDDFQIPSRRRNKKSWLN